MTLTVHEGLELLMQNICATDYETDKFYSMTYDAFWQLQEGLVTPQTDFQQVQWDCPPAVPLKEQNVFAIQPIQLYAVQDHYGYAFWLGLEALSVDQAHRQNFGQGRVQNARRLMYKTFTDATTMRGITPQSFRHTVPSLPYYMGHAQAGKLVLTKR